MKKRPLIIIIVLIFLFAASVIGYKFFFISDDEEIGSEKIEIQEEKKEVEVSDIQDGEKYKDNIIETAVYSYDYELILGDYAIKGSVYINKDKNLYISDSNSNYKISDLEFETLYKRDDIDGLLYMYALSKDGSVYCVFLNTTDIKDIKLKEIERNYKVINFTDLEFKTLNNISFSNLMILSEDGYIFEITTGMRYAPNILSLNEEFYIYEDNTIANMYGNMIKDEKGNYLKIKYYIQLTEESIFDDALSFIITENNRIIYNKDINGTMNTYMCDKAIEYMDYYVEDYKVNLNITFEHDIKLELTGYFSDYYGFE